MHIIGRELYKNLMKSASKLKRAIKHALVLISNTGK
jgi:hypothetical protein